MDIYFITLFIIIPLVAYIFALIANYAKSKNRLTLYKSIYILPSILLFISWKYPIILGYIAIYYASFFVSRYESLDFFKKDKS